jgi:hypothetical protein
MELSELVRIIGDRVDEGLPPAVFRSFSVRLDEYRFELSSNGLCWVGQADSAAVDAQALDASAKAAIEASMRSAGIVGAAGSMAGLFGVPPEAAARVIQSTRLAQRLSIIYGHDPTSDRGALHVRRALAAAWEFDLPPLLSGDLRLTDLPEVFRANARSGKIGPGQIARTLTTTALSKATKRVSRLIPGLGVALGLVASRKSAQQQGETMHALLRRTWLPPTRLSVEDAVEVVG